MPLVKELYPNLEIDYTDGFDLEGVEIPADVMKRIWARIPPDELTPEGLLNECLKFGLMKREEDSLVSQWQEEAAHRRAQEYGRMGRRKADAGIGIMWDAIQHEANQIWKRQPYLSKSEVAKHIARDMKNGPPEDRRSARTIRGRITKPNK